MQIETCAYSVSQCLQYAVGQDGIGKSDTNEELLKHNLHDLELFLNKMIVSRLKTEAQGMRSNPRILNQFLNRPNPSTSACIRRCIKIIDRSVRLAKRLCLFSDSTPRQPFLGVLTSTNNNKIDRQRAREEIICLLILEDCNNLAHPISVVPIYWTPGSGKSSLAYAVFHDSRVRDHFDMKLWVNIATDSTCRLLWQLFTLPIYNDLEPFNKVTVDQFVSQLHKKLQGKKYLLVLDNLSGEDPKNWFSLEPLLSSSDDSQYGSKILVTTLSNPMEWRGLGHVEEEERKPLMINIGFEICNKCANNPRVITLIASILFCEISLEKWQYFNDNLLTSVEDPVSCILSAVDLMQQLSKPKQQLLNYSSLFPLDYKFDRVELNLLWEVQSLVDEVPWDSRGSRETFNKCFKKLKRKYFLEHRVRDRSGYMVFYKVPILLHKVVKHLVGYEYGLVDGARKEIFGHASIIADSSWRAPSWLLFSRRKLKTLLFLPTKSSELINIPEVGEILGDQRALKVLDLSIVNCTSCLHYVWDLKHLRFLRLGLSKSISECITNLQFLQTLDLRYSSIRELPENFHEMRRLRHLYTGEKLIDLPPKFGELTNLQTLDVYIAGENNGLDTLGHFTLLGGKPKIRFQEGRYKHVLTAEASFIEAMKLDELLLEWPSSRRIPAADTYQQKDAIEFELLKPPFTMKSLALHGWQGVRFPRWAKYWFSMELNNIVSIHLVDCNRCQYLPPITSLFSLRSLQLWGLNALEWVEYYDDSSKVLSPTICSLSLRYILLANLPKLKGWSNVDEYNIDCQPEIQRKFNCLSELRVSSCPKLLSMPLAPTIKMLEAVNIDQKLLKQLLGAQESPASSSASIESSTLKELHINTVNELLSFSITIPSLHDLTVRECRSLTNVIIESSSSLRRLKLRGCHSLKDVSPSLENFHALEEVEIDGCEELNWEDLRDIDEGSSNDSAGAAWQGLKSLRSLTLTNISKPEPLPRGLGCYRGLKELFLLWLYNMTVLPESIGCLSQLDRLVIRYCPKLNKLPESFPNLKSLTYLEIKECPKLERRCKQPNGEDCNLIQYIPNIHLGDRTAQQGDC